jgi:hypothetical protein
VNVEYRILDQSNNRLFDNLSLVGGYGISTKMPTLLYLYPDKAYFDESSATYLKPDLSKGLAVMTTKIIDDASNPMLKPAVSNKFELGLAAAIGKMSGNITYFNERINNEFDFRSVPVIVPYNTYSIPVSGSSGDRVDDFYFRNGGVFYTQGGVEYPASMTGKKNFRTYLSPSNARETTKRGIEYSFNWGRIPLLRTSVMTDGAWLYVKRRQNQDSYRDLLSTLGTDYPYLPVMPAGSGMIESRVNTNFRLITHIPELKMVFSTTVQVVWTETMQSFYQDEKGNKLYYKAVDPQSGNKEERYYVNPVGFLDKAGQYTTWEPAFYDTYEYRRMISVYAHNNYFGKETYPLTAIFNFRLTKEFGEILNFSFIANNFLNISKKHKNTTSSGYSNLTIPIYFGAEITIKI